MSTFIGEKRAQILGAVVVVVLALGTVLYARSTPLPSARGVHAPDSRSAVLPAAEARAVFEDERAAGDRAPSMQQGAKVALVGSLLSTRPPALGDPHERTTLDAETQARYSARAARAKRLNARLSQHIAALEAESTAERGEARSQLAKELDLLRQNLEQRQQFEREAAPAPGARPIPQ